MDWNLLMPGIVKETCSGILRCSLQDEMFQKREIECAGEITQESAYSLILQLRYLAKEAPGEEIVMYINSRGGEVSSGLALYDVMKAIKCPIRTVCVGMAASMGALIFASGDQREILPHARIMIHDPLLAGGISGSALKVDNLSKELMKMRTMTCEILATHTGKTLEEIYAKTATDSYFTAEEAVAFGLADRIINEM